MIRSRAMASPRWTLVLLAAAACGDNLTRPPDGAVPIDAMEIDAPPDGDPLDTLAGTGLCADRGCMVINPGIREYVPRFQLWDDTAEKRRWIYLPPGTKIDTTDMDHWVFPIGTKVWKEFTRGTTRVETRMIYKRLPDDEPGAWFYATYQWNATQDGTMAMTGGVQNANGTQHDIPTRSACRECHERFLPSRVLGFDAIQLDHDAPAGLTDLDDLIAADLLTVVPAGGATPRFPLPGTAVDAAALGYFHGNCGHCHNPTSDLHMAPTVIDLRLRTGALATVAGTPAYMSAVNQPVTIPYLENGKTDTVLIVPNDPANSAVISRMNSMISLRFMPNVAVETVDPDGQAALVAWINSL